jgi:hypothetical protein
VWRHGEPVSQPRLRTGYERDTSVWRTAGRRALYDSGMCSTTDEWLGRICQAIDELADTTKEAAPVARLAAIWEMVADANPELAKRLPGYLSAAE